MSHNQRVATTRGSFLRRRTARVFAGSCLLLAASVLSWAGARAKGRVPGSAAASVPVLRVVGGPGASAGLAAGAQRQMATPSSGRLELDDHQQQLLRRRFEAQQAVDRRLGPHGISRKGQERAARRRARIELARKQGGEAAALAAAAEPDTLHVLLVRIAFDTDRSGSLTSVTQDGNFLCQPDTTVLFDPPPHDKAFFQAHLRGLSEYWGSMSEGRLTIDARVLPEAACDGYRLPDIADYGPGSGGFWSLDGLVRLVKDMIEAADVGTQGDGTVNLADYDFDDPNTYIIFAHAGGSLQSNLVFEEGEADYSPNDIPTFFVQLGDEDSVTLTSTDSETGEPGLVTECSVVPESTSQDGLVGSIAAALYHEFGHALGLPDLYSTTVGLPCVGYWDLMDNGTNLAAAVATQQNPNGELVVGLLPPSTSIWSKWFLGWVEPQRVGGRPAQIELRTTQSQRLPAGETKAVQLDVSPNEFFLAENRFIPTVAEDNWALISDPQTGVVQYLGRVLSEDPLVTENTHEYDFFMPWGGGLLLWRVRQDRIDERISTNTVQRERDDLGLELIEADGIPDIGVLDFATVGFVGSETDAFREQTSVVVDADLTVVYPRTATSITPTSVPGTRSTFGVDTGAVLQDISTATRVMTLGARVEGLLGGAAGFPVMLPHVAGQGGTGSDVPLRGQAESLCYFQFSPAGTELPSVLVAAQPSDSTGAFSLHAFGVDGAPRFGAASQVFQFDAPLAGPPAWVRDFDGTGSPGGDALVAVTRAGALHAFSRAGAVAGLLAQVGGNQRDFGAPVTHGPIVVSTQSALYVLAADTVASALYVMDSTGADPGTTLGSPWSQRFRTNFNLGTLFALRSAPCAADLDGSGFANELAFVAGDALHLAEVSGEPLAGGESIALPGQRAGEAGGAFWVVAWPTAQGPDRLVVASAMGGLWMVSRGADLAWSAEFFGRRLADPVVGEPAVGDLDGDGRLDLVVATDQYVIATNEAGVTRTGFPLLLREAHLVREERDDGVSSTPIIADVTGDGMAEILVVSQFGLLHAFQANGREVAGFPRAWSGGGAVAPLVADVPAVGAAAAQRALFLFDALGDTLVQARRTRSARLTGVACAAPHDVAQRSAEWLGRAGGMFRQSRPSGGFVTQPQAGDLLAGDFQPRIVPNPCRGTLARVRFFSRDDQTAHVTLYSLEGEQVLTTSAAVDAGLTAEIPFSSRRLVPGGYVCRLDYVGPHGPATEMMTFYVER